MLSLQTKAIGSIKMPQQSPKNELSWLNENPRLQELMERYPELWEDTGKKLVAAASQGQANVVNELIHQAKSAADLWSTRIAKSRNNPKVIESGLPYILKSRMLLLALDKCNLAAAAGKVHGKVRLNLWNGYIIQKLLFSHHLTRRPVSLRLFHFWWHFISQKKLLIPLVQMKGIYCFYSKELVRQLTQIIGDRKCLEIAAGDGTLARFLREQGSNVIATDDYSWKHAIEYSEEIEKIGAKQALEKHQPQAVLCSWPPPGNNFEKHVFATESTELYIMIGSRYQFASGDWASYSSQTKFDWSIDEQLSKLVIPPELESAVIVFRRKQ